MNAIHPLKVTNISSVYTTEGYKIVAGTRVKGLLVDGEEIIQGIFEIGTVGEDGNLNFHFIMNNEGNVGINTIEEFDSPTAKLHVHGSVRFSDLQGEGELIKIDVDGNISRTNAHDFADKNLVFNVNYKLFEVISHGMNKKPAVDIVNADNHTCLAGVEHIDDNTVRVTFSDYFTGKVIFN